MLAGELYNCLDPALAAERDKTKQLFRQYNLATTEAELLEKAQTWIREVGKSRNPWEEDGFRIPGGAVHSKAGFITFASVSALAQDKTFGNYPAVKAIMNAVYEGAQLDFDRALGVEIRYFTQCALSPESRNMIRTLFFNLNQAKSGAARPKDIPKTNIRKVGVLGAGMMGAGIAYVTAHAGLDVALTSSKIPQGIGGRKAFGKLLHRAIEHGLTERDALAALTTAPADLLGVGDRVGTIQAGKLANVVLASKPIFEKGAAIRDVWIEGRRHEVTPREARPRDSTSPHPSCSACSAPSAPRYRGPT